MAILPYSAKMQDTAVNVTQGSPWTTSNTLAVSANDCVIVAVRSGNTSGGVVHGTTGITDSAGQTYTFAAKYEGNDPSLYIYYKENHPGGTVTLTDTFANLAGCWYTWLHAVAYTGAALSGAKDTAGCNTFSHASTPNFFTDNIAVTPTDSLIFGVCFNTTAFQTYTAGSGFTLVDGAIGVSGTAEGNAGTNAFGGSVEKILAGSWTTAPATADAATGGNQTAWTAGYIVLNAAAGGGGGTLVNPPTLTLTGVQ